jgi:glyoxylase-like metal-dependent hydrolase (beta-lactamase superfamily II)
MAFAFEWLAAGYCTHPEFMSIRGGSFSQVPFPARFGILRHKSHGVILVDTGYSSHFFDETKTFPTSLYAKVTPVTCESHDTALMQLKQRGISPEDVSAVFITHFHADHIAGILDFPRAKIICSRTAFEGIVARKTFANLIRGVLPHLLPKNLAERALWIESSQRKHCFTQFDEAFDIFGDSSLLAISLPGHASGQFGIVFQTDLGRNIFILSDAVWHSKTYRELLFPNPLVRILSENHAVYQKTIRNIHALYQERNDLVMLPTHCTEIATGRL